MGVMMDKQSVEKNIESCFEKLPPVLQRAARFVLANPNDIALESMRSAASKANLQPASMLRLARFLGFESYETFREIYRTWLTERDSPFTGRANALRKRAKGDLNSGLVTEILNAEVNNLAETFSHERTEQILAAHSSLMKAKSIYVVGLRSLFPAAYYFAYACRMFLNNVTLLGSVGGAFADELRHIGPDDALITFSYTPYAQDAVRAVLFSKERGAKIISVTDSVLSPIASSADSLIILSTSTPSLFPSVVPALATAQTLAALMLANSNEEGLREIANSEAQLKNFHAYIE